MTFNPKILKSKSAILIAIQLASLALGFAKQISLTNWLGAYNFGIYSYIFTITTLLGLVGKFGMDKAGIRFIPPYVANKQWTLLNGFLIAANMYAFTISLFLVIAYLSWIFFIQQEAEQLKLAFYISILIIPISALTSIRTGILRALKSPILADIPEKILSSILIIGSIFVAKHFLPEGQALYGIMVLAGTSIIVFMVGFGLQIKIYPKVAKKESRQFEHRLWASVGIPFIFISGCQVLMNSADKLMLANYISFESVGIYTVTQQISILGGLLSYAIFAVLAPTISVQVANKKTAELQKLVTRAAKKVFFGSAALSICLVIASPFILTLFGAEFLIGSTTLYILIFRQFLDSNFGIVMGLLNMSGQQKTVIKILFFSLLLNVIMNVVLIPRFGIEGAAIATVLSTLFRNAVALKFVKSSLKVNPSLLPI